VEKVVIQNGEIHEMAPAMSTMMTPEEEKEMQDLLKSLKFEFLFKKFKSLIDFFIQLKHENASQTHCQNMLYTDSLKDIQ
jgi:hypothetical protein